MFVWLLFSVACTPPEDVPVVEEPDDPLPIPELEARDTTAVWTAGEAAAAVQIALEGPFPSPFVLRASLNDWFDHGDAECPGPGTMMAGPSFEGCTSGEGWYFLGVGGYSETFTETEEFGPYVELNLMGDLTLVAPASAEGGTTTLDIGGHWITVLHEIGPSWRTVLNGSWREPASDQDWLANGISAWLDYTGTLGEGGRFLTLDGALTIRGASLGFDDMSLGVPGCGEVPIGAVRVLDPSGGAWSFDFGTACTPCGEVTFDGVPVETDACLALDGLADRVIEASLP